MADILAANGHAACFPCIDPSPQSGKRLKDGASSSPLTLFLPAVCAVSAFPMLELTFCIRVFYFRLADLFPYFVFLLVLFSIEFTSYKQQHHGDSGRARRSLPVC